MSKARLSRRTLLRGVGVAIGLPLLEAMEPLRALGAEPAGKAPVRLMFIYVPGGFYMDAWAPKGEGASYALSPTLLPLEKFKSDLLVLSGLDARNGETAPNGHPGACAPWLSSAPINRRDSSGFCTDVSVDQMVARKVGETTRLASLEVGTNHNPTGAHGSNVSWRAPGSPMGKEVHPRAVFARLFGDPKGDKYRKSILDFVKDGSGQIRKSLGVTDQAKVDEYLDSIRSIEKRIQFVERNNPPPPPKVDWLDSGNEQPAPEDPKKGAKAKAPGAIPILEHIRMISELVALGFRADSTRVATFMYENEDSFPALPEHGVSDHHGLAHAAVRAKSSGHTGEDARLAEEHKKVDRIIVEQFAKFLETLKGVREGEGTLLDNCLIVFGSGLSWGGWHARNDLPLVLAGRGGGTVKPGRHLRYPKGTPFSNLLVALAERMGVKPERFADSTGPLPNLS